MDLEVMKPLYIYEYIGSIYICKVCNTILWKTVSAIDYILGPLK